MDMLRPSAEMFSEEDNMYISTPVMIYSNTYMSPSVTMQLLLEVIKNSKDVKGSFY